MTFQAAFGCLSDFRPGVKHDVALEPPLQLNGDRDAFTLLDREVPRRDRERRVRPAAQQRALQRDPPFRIQNRRDQEQEHRRSRQPLRRPRRAARARPDRAAAAAPGFRSLPPGHPPGSGSRLRSGSAPRRARHTGRRFGSAGQAAGNGSRSRRRFAAWSTTAGARSPEPRGPPVSGPSSAMRPAARSVPG